MQSRHSDTKHQSRHVQGETLSIKFYAYGKGIFLWPLVVFLPIIAGLSYLHLNAEILGWAYVAVLALVLLTVTVDVTRNAAIVFLLVVLALLFLCLYVDETTIPIFQPLTRGIRLLHVQFDRGQAWSMFGLGVIVVGYSIIVSRINGRWHMTTVELQHHQFGKRGDSYARGAKTFSTEYNNWLELLLGFSGTIVISDSSNRQVVRRIPHVLLLPFRMGKIEKILATRVVIEQDDVSDHDHDGQDSDEGGHV